MKRPAYWEVPSEQPFQCPRCAAPLVAQRDAMQCRGCSAVYPIDSGVVRFIGDDAFYEGQYQNQTKFVPSGNPLSLIPLYFINVHYLWWMRRFVPEGSELLELGCGSGVRYFGERTRATGMDMSFTSLRHLDPTYARAVQGDALHMPFCDGSFDFVVSSFFYEHISLNDRPQLLAELRRVLRPGGKIIFLFDLACFNPLYKWFRKNEAKFQECFVEHDHHYGLERASENLERFKNAGFRVVRCHIANKTPLQHLPVYQWAEPYGHPLTHLTSRLARAISQRSWLAKPFQVGVTLLDDVIEPVIPMDWGRIMLVCLESR